MKLPIVNASQGFLKAGKTHQKEEKICSRSTRSFLKRVEGASSVEFAFVAPFLLVFILGLFEIGFMLVIQNALDGAAREASRYGLTGQDGGGDREAAILDRVQETARVLSGGLITPGDLLVTVSAYADLAVLGNPEPFEDLNENGQYDEGEPFEDINDSGEWEEDQGITGSFGLPGEAVYYVISYDWNVLVGGFAGFGPVVTLRGEAPVANEDF